MMELQQEQIQRFREFVLHEYPFEAVAAVSDGKVVPLPNVADEPQDGFGVRTQDLLRQKVDALLHSHTYNKRDERKFDGRTPSYKDVRTQIAMNIPWGIVATEGETVTPILWFPQSRDVELLNRKFVYYVFDCWTLVRDWYWQNRQIELMYYPDIEINPHKGLMEDAAYERFADEAGFKQITFKELEVGDVFLMNSFGRRTNHAAVYVGDGNVMHHWTTRKSEVFPLNALRSFLGGMRLEETTPWRFVG